MRRKEEKRGRASGSVGRNCSASPKKDDPTLLRVRKKREEKRNKDEKPHVEGRERENHIGQYRSELSSKGGRERGGHAMNTSRGTCISLSPRKGGSSVSF